MVGTLRQDQPLSKEAFLDDLYGWQAEVCRPARITRAIHAGTAPLEAVRNYARERFYPMWYSGQLLAGVLTVAPDMESFLPFAENVARETGFYQTKNHAKLFLQFCEGL